MIFAHPKISPKPSLFVFSNVLMHLLFAVNPIFSSNLPEIKKTTTDIYARFVDFTPYLGSESGRIIDIEQDDYGYIWLAGTKGLFRFNGNTTKHYVNDWTPGALPSSRVYCIEKDVMGRLWIGTENGLCHYDYESDTFIEILGMDSASSSNNEYYIRSIFADGDSLLWVDTQAGYLWKLNLKNLNVISKYKHTFTDQPYYHYNVVYRDNDNSIWLGSRGKGPFLLDENTGRFKRLPVSILKDIPGKKRDNDAAWVHHDKHDNIWIGSTDGIYVFDKKRNYYHLFYQTSSWAMTEDHNGSLWFAISSGVCQYKPATGQMVIYLPNEEDKGSLKGTYILDIFEDNYNQIWIATRNGVSVLKPENKGVKYLFHIPGIENTPASSSITALACGTDGNIWIGTSNHGVDNYNPLNQEFRHFNKDNTKGLIANNIRAISMGTGGKVYCGLWAGVGFGVLSPKTRSFQLYAYDSKTTKQDWYNDLTFDNKGNLYLGFWGADGLTLFDTVNGKFVRSLKNKFQLAYDSRLVTCLEWDKNDNLWMGTTISGLHLYLPKKDTSICFLPEVNRETGIDEKKINCLGKDPYGNIWIGANSLYFASADKQSVEKIELNKDYLPLEIFGLLAENNNSIWLMTDRGLLLYNKTSQSITDYSSAVNLQFAEDYASALKIPDGRLLFGGKNGLALLDIETIELNNPTPQVFLSSLSVFDKVKVPNIMTRDSILLNHKENFFTIQVASNEWGRHKRFQYFYKLEGFDKNWKLLPTEFEATFTNVPAGTYSFRIKIEDKQGNKYPDVAGCNIIIEPPFWMNWWFILTIILIVGLGLFFAIRTRINTVSLALQNSELDQKLLRLQMNPHFIFNSLFAIQSYIYSKQTHLAGNYLSDFAHLIRLILDNSRNESIPLQTEIETIELYLKLQKLRLDEKFDYSIEVDNELTEGDYDVPPMLAQPFLENAVEHGLRNLKRKGEIIVKYQLLKKMIRFSVTDNGIGLTISKQQRDESSHKHESLAIEICKNRLELLRKQKGGNITFLLEEIKTADGTIKGTRVAFNIPID